MQKILIASLVILMFVGCKQAAESTDKGVDASRNTASNQIKNARGFSLVHYSDYSILEVHNPWPEAQKSFKYLLYNSRTQMLPQDADEAFDAQIQIPLKTLVVTSTTHIPSLEALNSETKLVGFPNTNYVSSTKTRALIDSGAIKELGGTEQINLELLIDAAPEAVIGFGVDGDNKTLDRIQQAGIPVIFNGDWVEQDPLGKAEWIKFFGALLDKNREAEQIFDGIATEYKRVKSLALNDTKKPTVLSGAMYKDVWYLPKGTSWAAQFIKDASGNYLYADSQGTGSLSLSVEAVLEKAHLAEFWIGPGQFTSLEQMKDANAIYSRFEAFKTGQIYSFTNLKGPTGGVIYYELAPNRPDLVLKDMIKIMHPDLLPEYSLRFFTKLQ